MLKRQVDSHRFLDTKSHLDLALLTVMGKMVRQTFNGHSLVLGASPANNIACLASELSMQKP